MEITLYCVVVSFPEERPKLYPVYKDNGKPALFTSKKKALKFLGQTKKFFAGSEYAVIKKKTRFELN